MKIKNMTKQERTDLIAFIIAIIITSICMFIFIGQKAGWHEDEIFSYGASNYRYDNMFQTSGHKDEFNKLVDEKIMSTRWIQTLKNLAHYTINYSEFFSELEERYEKQAPAWKTSEQAKEYMTVSEDEVFSYWSVYYNQSRDVHPPLFYMLVHFVSSLCLNHFSKYIIFTINLVFYVASCCTIYKILKLFHKENLSAIVVLLYGLSMGGITTVIFQRMYMMLTFFILTYLYLNLKICKNEFVISKSTKRELIVTVILGFLTQYYFCIYALLLAIISVGIMIKQKKFVELKYYIWCHILAAIIGVLLFPASIYHIFFSYRGVAGGVVNVSYIERLKQYFKLLFYSFSLPELLGYIVFAVLMILVIYKMITGKRKDIIFMVSIPTILFIFMIAKISPMVNIRYISPIFPIIAVAVIWIAERIMNTSVKVLFKKMANKKVFWQKNTAMIIITMLTVSLSAYGLKNSEPYFIYKNYKQRIELAETYQNLKLVYIGEAPFNHLQDMEEFLIYQNSIIVNTWELEALKNNEGLADEKEFILNMKCWISNFDENLHKVLNYTNATNYELLLDDGESRLYKVKR